jgi:hypothetical protein
VAGLSAAVDGDSRSLTKSGVVLKSVRSQRTRAATSGNVDAVGCLFFSARSGRIFIHSGNRRGADANARKAAQGA